MNEERGKFYQEVRMGTRNVLDKTGIESNPDFLNHELLSAIREKLNLPPVAPWDEMDDYTHELFVAALIGSIIQAGGEIADPSSPAEILNNLHFLLSP